MKTGRTLSAEEFQQELSQGHIPPILLLLGEETYFHDQILRFLKSELLGQVSPEFSTFTFFLTESPLQDALDAASTRSLLAPRKIVLIRELDRLRENQIKDGDESALAKYLEDPNPQTLLVISAEKLDARRRVSQLLMKNAWTIDCSPLPNGSLLHWVKTRLQQENIEIEPYAIRELIEAVGSNLTLLEHEVQKLISFIGRRNRITVEDVDLLIFRTRVDSVFDLVDAINARDRPRSLDILNNLFENDVKAQEVLFWLARLYRQLLRLKEQRRRLDVWGAVRLLRVPKEFAERLLRQERKFSREELMHSFHRFASLDRSIKSSSVDPKVQCEFFIFSLMQESDRRTASL
jgi:DNA polymerase-3 subunit delta